MNSLQVLLVDDEPLASRRLAALLGDVDGVEVVGTAESGFDALKQINALNPDLVMLDIQMPGMSGLRVAADLPEGRRPEIVFVTAFEQYAPDAFEVEAADYLLKPVRFDRLRAAVERARRRRIERQAVKTLGQADAKSDETAAKAIWIQTSHGKIRVDVDQIDWIEAARDYVLLHTKCRSFMHRISMSALEAALPSLDLMRVHRSTFVRLSLVKAVQRHSKGSMLLELEDGTTIQVGPSFKSSVMARLHHLSAF